MQLPFLKEKKWPRIAKPMEQKSYGISPAEELEEFCIGELMDACKDKNISAFRKALEALVLSCFEEEESDA